LTPGIFSESVYGNKDKEAAINIRGCKPGVGDNIGAKHVKKQGE